MRNCYLFIAALVFLIACKSESERYFELGKTSYDNGRYSNAIANFIKIRETDANYTAAQEYLTKIDSITTIEKANLEKELARQNLNNITNTIRSHHEKQQSLRSKETWPTLDDLISDLHFFEAVVADMTKVDQYPDSDNLQQITRELKTNIPKIQSSLFPKMRKRYGEILADQLWRENVVVRTKGTKHKTIEFVGGFFASNANIEDSQKAVRDFLLKLRFTTSEYKWRESQDDYTYYSMKPKEDSEL